MCKSYFLKFLFFLVVIFDFSNLNAQDTKSAILFANHTPLEFTTEVRVNGETNMVDIGKIDILAWENGNYHELGDRILATILDIVFDIDVSHNDKGNLAKCERFAFLGNQSYRLEIDIQYEEDLLFTIEYEFEDIFLSLTNPTIYNIKYPDGNYDVNPWYSLLNEQNNQPHLATRDIIIEGLSYKLIYGTFNSVLDPTNNLLFSLSEKTPINLNFEPPESDIENPTILNLLAYNIGLLMPLNANDQEERERVLVMHKAIPKNMDIIMWQEMFEQNLVNRIIDSLIEDYPYYTSPHNRPDIPGLTKNGGALIMSKHPILEERDFSYSRDAGIPGVADNALADKGVKYAKINKNGQIIHVFNTHTGGEALENDAMGKWMYEILNQNYYDIVIMGGDMNTKIYEQKYYRMIDSLQAATPTYKTLLSNEMQTRGTTWGFNHYGQGRSDEGQMIDYIFVSKQFKMPTVYFNETQTYRLNILDKDFWGIFDLGDHQPVYGRLEFPTINATISDTTVCVGDNFNIDVSTSLNDFIVQWYKDDALLAGESDLSLTRNNISESDWGIYRCEVLYTYEADSLTNGAPTHFPTYNHPGPEQGKLVRQFNVSRDESLCGLVSNINNISKKQFTVYPNPTSDKLYFDTNGEVFQIKVLGINGSVLLEKEIAGSEQITVENWEASLYIVEWYKNKKLIGTVNVVKQ